MFNVCLHFCVSYGVHIMKYRIINVSLNFPNPCILDQACINSGSQVTRATKFCTVLPNRGLQYGTFFMLPLERVEF